MRYLRQFVTLARLTALEAVRQPIFLLLTLTCVVLTTLVPMLLMHQFGEDGKLVRDSGLAFHFFFGLFIAGYVASGSLARERKLGTAAAVLSKPVSSDLFFVAKFAGIAAVILAFSLCSTTATLLSERVAQKFVFSNARVGYVTDWNTGRLLLLAPVVAFACAGLFNYVTKRPFESAAFTLLLVCLLAVFVIAGFFDRTGHLSPFNPRVSWRIGTVSALVTMALLVLSAIALSLSVRLNTVATLSACGVIFLLGLMSDYLFGRHVAIVPVQILYWLIPNWQHFWLTDALNGGGTVPAAYSAGAGLYAAVYTAGVLAIGLIVFRHSEVTA